MKNYHNPRIAMVNRHWRLILAGFLLIPWLARSQMPVWTNHYNGTGNGDDIAVAMAVDRDGNVIVTGHSVGIGNADPHYATIKYSNAGVPQWTNRYEGPVSGWDQATALGVDADGNVIVTGYSGSNGGFDFATIKYSSTGAPLWTNRYDGPGSNYDQANAIAVDAVGNVYVTGSSAGSGTGEDYATIAYSSAGVPLWTNRYTAEGVHGPDRAYAIGVDTNGNVYVTGYSYGTNGVEYATLAYSSSGVPLWTNRFGPAGSSAVPANALAVAPSGGVYMTGPSWNGSNDDYVTIAYSGVGVPLWTNRYNGPGNGADGPAVIAVDQSGNIVVAGHSGFNLATIAYSNTGATLWTNYYANADASALAVDINGNVYVTGSIWHYENNQFHYGFVTISYSSAGVLLWTNRYDGPGVGGGNDYDQANAVAVDASGNVYVTGYSLGSSTNYDYATIRLSPAPGLSILSARPIEQSPLTNDTGYTVSVATNGSSVEHRLFFGGHHFLSVVDAAGAFVLRPHPGVDRNGWGSSLYLQPFLPGAVLRYTTISNVIAAADGISLVAGGSVSRGSNQTFGSWSANLAFTYEPAAKRVRGSGTYAVNLSGNLSSDTGDLNLYKLASSYLRNVPLLNGTTNDTGDMLHAIVSGSAFPTFTWIPWQLPGHFPSDTADSIAVEVVGQYNSVDTASQGFCPIQAAWKPSLKVTLTSRQAGIPMISGGIYDEARAHLFYEDNVGITPLLLRSSPELSFVFDVELESSALAGDGSGVEVELTVAYSRKAENSLEVFFSESVQGPYSQFVGTLPMVSPSIFAGTIAVTRPAGGQPESTTGFFKARTPCSVQP